MRVKKYLVKCLDEAEYLVENDLGSEAVILTTKEIDFETEKQYEILAGIAEVSEDNTSEAYTIQNPLLQEIIHKETSQFTQREYSNRHFNSEYYLNFLVTKGISYNLSAAIVQKCNELDEKDQEYFKTTIKKEVLDILTTCGSFVMHPSKTTVMAIVGPSGVGKSSTIMKLALRYNECSTKVGIISIESNLQEFGVLEQFSKRHKLPFILSNGSLEHLRNSVEQLSDCKLILIDTFGFGIKHGSDLKELSHIIWNLGECQVDLVLSLTTKDSDLLALIKLYGQFLPESIIFTKADETTTPGTLLNMCHETKMAISFISSGHRTEDFQAADPENLLIQILKDL